MKQKSKVKIPVVKYNPKIKTIDDLFQTASLGTGQDRKKLGRKKTTNES